MREYLNERNHLCRETDGFVMYAIDLGDGIKRWSELEAEIGHKDVAISADKGTVQVKAWRTMMPQTQAA